MCLCRRLIVGLGVIVCAYLPYRSACAAADAYTQPGTLHQMTTAVHQAQLRYLLQPQHLSVHDKLEVATTEYPHEVTLQYGEFILRESTQPIPFQSRSIRQKSVAVLPGGVHGMWYTVKTLNGDRHILLTQVRGMYLELIPNLEDDRWSETTVSHIVGSLRPITFPT